MILEILTEILEVLAEILEILTETLEILAERGKKILPVWTGRANHSPTAK